MVTFKVINLNLDGVERQLERIANLLEQILISDKLDDYVPPQPGDVYYTDEEEEIVEYHLRKVGKGGKD